MATDEDSAVNAVEDKGEHGALLPVVDNDSSALSLLLSQAEEATNESRQWEEKAAEFRRTSELKRAQARKLCDEAAQFDLDAIRADKKSEKANIQASSLTLKSILLRLNQNDPDLVEVDTEHFLYGCGKALGEALLQSTAVESLELDFPSFLSDDGLYERDLKPFFQFLRTSTSLTTLGVFGDLEHTLPCIPHVSRLILRAISESKTIQVVRWTLRVPAADFVHMVLSTPTLIKLNVSFVSEHYTDEEREMIASAFGAANTSLEAFILPLSNYDLTVRILSHLPQLSSLRELTVGGNGTDNFEQDYRYFEAISHYLSSTKSLQRLHLANLSFDGPSMAQVLDGLLVHFPANAAPSIFIAGLSFSQCTLTDEAIEQLVAFLQTPIITDNQNETEASFVNKSCLRELFVQVDPTSTSRFATGLADALLMIEKTSKTSKGHEKKTDDLLSRTIGSQICSVQIVGVQSEFLHHLRCHASRARFQTLALDQISKSASVALSKCLPHLVHLEELIVKDVEAGSSTNWIVQGLRSNGSICYVSTENDDGDETNFDATQLRLIQAYCDRNKALGPMIAAEIAPDPTCDRDTTGKGDINDDAISSRCSQAPVSQRPTLLQASKPTFRIQGSLALRGLLALDQSQDETWTGEE